MLSRMDIRVGTASWTDPSLIKCGRFYPPGVNTAEGRLRYYATRFNVVEVDSSWYFLPSAHNAMQWVERTPADFVFNVKAFRALTAHQVPVAAIPKDLAPAVVQPGKKNVYYRNMPGEIRDELWRRFTAGVAPLRAGGKLGAIHFQFAPWFTFGRESIDYLQECAERLAGWQVSMEFRQRSWFADAHRTSTLDALKAIGAAHTVCDEPQGFANSVPQVWAVTSAYALVRLHGRNAATWNIRGTAASDRFDYDYSNDELAEIGAQIRSHLGDARRVDVIFNNNREDEAQRNGRTLAAMLHRA